MKKTTKPTRLDRDAARKLRQELITEIENDNPLLTNVRGGAKSVAPDGLKG